MGLLDDLRGVAANLDPSLQPSSNEIGPLLGALIHYQEHGDKLLKAATPADVSELLAGDGAEPAAEAKSNGKDKDAKK